MDIRTSPKKICRAESKDRISNLPENVLSHILSLLPTEDAIRTSVLSRRWEYKWTSIYSLSFDDGKRYKTRRGRKRQRPAGKRADFMNFVDQVLGFCKSSTVKRFHLSCVDKYDPCRVKAWIATALCCNVERLHISYNGDLLFPRWFYNCDSLTKLELNRCTFKIPDNMCFSNLRTLNISKVEFHLSLRSGRLLFTLPVLEVFLSSGSKWWNVKVLRIEAPILATFEMTDSVIERDFDGSNECKIEICGDKLENFKCTVGMFATFEISSPSRIVDASLKYMASSKDDLNPGGEVGFRGHKLMGGFSDFITSLELSTDLVEVLAHKESPYPLPIFSKLTHLKMYSARTRIKCDSALTEFLKTVPVLESLTFDGYYSSEAADDYKNIKLMSGDFLSRLKVVKLEYQFDCPVNNPLVKFLLQNAVVLKELLICSKY